MKLRYKLCNILNLEPNGHYKMCYAMCMNYTLEILFYVRSDPVIYYVVICVFWAANVMCKYVMCQHVMSWVVIVCKNTRCKKV